MKRLALVLTCLAGPLCAQGYDGTYQIGACTAGVSDGRMSIAGDTIRFWESACTLTAPVPVRDMEGATLFDMLCSGEGESWTARVLLMPGLDSDLIVLREGLVVEYQRCN